MVDERLAMLPRRDRRGSRARCIILTNGPRDEVAVRLNKLTARCANIGPDDAWMPRGFAAPAEACLDQSDLLPNTCRQALSRWWLAVQHPLANSPNWDIASTALIDGREGIVLVEAKAHANEIKSDGKTILASTNRDNHDRIDTCCREASDALNDLLPGWSLSTESHYQLCNRFAFAWKLASLGKPVVLLYLGFLNAAEMLDQGPPLRSASEWKSLVQNHGRGVVPEQAWDTAIRVGDVFVRAMIQSMTVNLDGEIIF